MAESLHIVSFFLVIFIHLRFGNCLMKEEIIKN